MEKSKLTIAEKAQLKDIMKDVASEQNYFSLVNWIEIKKHEWIKKGENKKNPFINKNIEVPFRIMTKEEIEKEYGS